MFKEKVVSFIFPRFGEYDAFIISIGMIVSYFLFEGVRNYVLSNLGIVIGFSILVGFCFYEAFFDNFHSDWERELIVSISVVVYCLLGFLSGFTVLFYDTLGLETAELIVLFFSFVLIVRSFILIYVMKELNCSLRGRFREGHAKPWNLMFLFLGVIFFGLWSRSLFSYDLYSVIFTLSTTSLLLEFLIFLENPNL